MGKVAQLPRTEVNVVYKICIEPIQINLEISAERRAKGGFSRIIAFEPDPVSYKKLCEKFSAESRVMAVNKGLYHQEVVLVFCSSGTRVAAINETGDTQVNMTSLDAVVGESSVSFIKMNVEGVELNALNGARETICRCRPKLAISAYNLPSHLCQVPFLMRELNPHYDLYLRQHDGGIIETVAYGKEASVDF